jgi:hypothetical protein
MTSHAMTPAPPSLTATAVPGRWAASTAVLAGLLWAVQAFIWTLGPKVQAEQAPHRIIDRPLFVLFWLTMVVAVLCSAATLFGLQQQQRERAGVLGRVSVALAGAAVAVAGAAGVAIIVAAVGAAEQSALGVLSLALNLSGVLLLVALTLAGIAALRARILPGWQAILPAVLACLTFLILGAILASSSRALAGLVFADVVVIVAGATWCLFGWALRTHGSSY